jgi:hypothetical protein
MSVAAATLMACGPGRPALGPSGAPSSIEVRVSAGAPIAGANVTVYAISDTTGAPNPAIGNAGVIGTGGPTDSAGKAIVALSTKGYSGPIQVVAGGPNLSYVDPCTAASSSTGAAAIQVPATFTFSSFLANYVAGTAVTVPTSILTTLADHEVLAYLQGRHPMHPGKKPLSAALADRDHLFVHHITTATSAWNPANFRITVPANLTAGSQTLIDTTYAAIFDITLNALAHRIAEVAIGTASSTAINAITLAQLLEQDLDADAVLDGRGEKGAALETQGTKPFSLDSQLLRNPFAQALDQWIQTKGVNQSGIAQADLVSAGVYDAISQDDSDLFGAPPAGPFDPIDRISPELAFVTEPNLNTTATSLTVSVTATDPSGVAHVWCQCGNSTPVAAQQGADGTWTCQANLVANQPNAIAIWADDGATPANGGQALGPPYRLTRSIVVDSSAPIANTTAIPNYHDERNMTVALSGNRASYPAVYAYASPKINIISGADLYKVGTRLGWSTQPTAAELEGANPDNIPFVQFGVSYNPQTDAAITTANYSVAISGHPTVTGALWPSARTEASNLYFDLPLASNLFPDLSALTGPTEIGITINLADAAGNFTSAVVLTVNFHVIGPPLAVVEDTGYPSANDPKSTYQYNIGNGQYEFLFDGGNIAVFSENVVRLVHYLVSNPASQPVAFVAPAPGSWAAVETWTARQEDTGNAYTLGTRFAGCETQPAWPASQNCNPLDGASYKTPVWFPAQGGWACGDPGVSDIYGNQTSAGLSTVAYIEKNGSEVAPAAMTNGQYLVPAAADGVPGVLSLYVVRPRSGLSRSVPIAGAAPWRLNLGDELKYRGGATCRIDQGTIGGYSVWEHYKYYNELTSAWEALTGSFRPLTSSFNGNPFGEPQLLLQTLTVTRNIGH